MRANLKCFLARLALASFATLGLSVTTFAHDLPDAKALARAHSVSTTGAVSVVSAAQPNDLLVVARPDVGDAPRPVASHAQSDDLIAVAHPDAGRAPRPVASHVKSSDLISVARPAVGTAPRPVAILAQAAAQPQIQYQPQAELSEANSAWASEVYMPYDFQLSDWRFGQFPYHARTASALSPVSLPSLARGVADVPQLAQTAMDESAAAHSAANAVSESITTKAPAAEAAVKLGPPSPQFVALGEFLQQLDQWQCTAYSVLSDGATLARSAERLSQTLRQLALNYRPTYMAAQSPAAVAPVPSIKQPSPVVGPQFVVYDSALGGHIVLTVDQARDWQFDAPAAQSRIHDALESALKPIQSNVLTHASRQLELAGHGLLSLSRSLTSFASANEAETKVASLPNRND